MTVPDVSFEDESRIVADTIFGTGCVRPAWPGMSKLDEAGMSKLARQSGGEKTLARPAVQLVLAAM